MTTALIGYSGFVGSNLLQKGNYDALYRANNIDEIRGRKFDHVVCAGVQAMKWWANLHPQEDLAGINRLLDSLKQVSADRFTLISSIDVYPAPRNVHEHTPIEREGHHAYGLNRLYVEDWVQTHFPKSAILRLPGLFGPGLKKNVIYDMLTNNDLHKVHPGGVFQYYDLRRLTGDIERTWSSSIPLLNVSSEPISTVDLRDRFFPDKVLGASGPPPSGYDMLSRHASIWNGRDGYLYTRENVLDDVESWLATGAQS